MKDNDVKGLRILVVDDEEDICDLIRFNLEEEGYVVSVSNNGMDALNKVERNLPDAIILDLMIPGISGMELCKKIKSRYDVPILMVTARAGETDAVLGLEMGADDYIRKPFSPRELTARLKVVLRRRGPGSDDSQGGNMVIGEIQMNTAAHRVTIGGQSVDLTLIEYKLLKLFMENPDIAFSRDRLLDRVWGRDVYVSDRAVDVNIKRLREKLLTEKQRLETVRGVGYRFRGDN
ncbi:MAG: DNA-binding response regulator [Spirochaetaceae bacterium]|nr:DNA-binding response regulator [Spirochaetaceae bacterium]|tara:strand:+ start:96841 stop:97542 length:702 start_codon:yes stop_codon:yes gene_type:complete